LSKVLADGRTVVAPGMVSVSVGGAQPDESAIRRGEAVSARMRLTGATIDLH